MTLTERRALIAGPAGADPACTVLIPRGEVLALVDEVLASRGTRAPGIRYTASPLGVLAEVAFASGGGGAAMGRDQAHAEALAAEIVAEHGAGRCG